MFKKRKIQDFRTRHNPQSLLGAAAKIFACNIPWVERDLTKKSWNTGQWRLMESPLFFLVRNRCLLDPAGNPFLLSQVYGDCGESEDFYEWEKDEIPHKWGGNVNVEDYDKAGEKFENSDLIPSPHSIYLNTKKRRVESSLDKKRLRRVLARQLGTDISAVNPIGFFVMVRGDDPKNRWRLGLACALTLMAEPGTRKDGVELLDAMNRSMGGSGEFDPERIDIGKSAEILPRVSSTVPRLWLKNTGIHSAWENVFFMSLLAEARRCGVVSTCGFGWAKAFDRTLWHALSSVGRTVAIAEAAGARAHWLCEEAMGEKIADPCVDAAIEGFEQEMMIDSWLPEKQMEK